MTCVGGRARGLAGPYAFAGVCVRATVHVCMCVIQWNNGCKYMCKVSRQCSLWGKLWKKFFLLYFRFQRRQHRHPVNWYKWSYSKLFHSDWIGCVAGAGARSCFLYKLHWKLSWTVAVHPMDAAVRAQSNGSRIGFACIVTDGGVNHVPGQTCNLWTSIHSICSAVLISNALLTELLSQVEWCHFTVWVWAWVPNTWRSANAIS